QNYPCQISAFSSFTATNAIISSLRFEAKIVKRVLGDCQKRQEPSPVPRFRWKIARSIQNILKKLGCKEGSALRSAVFLGAAMEFRQKPSPRRRSILP